MMIRDYRRWHFANASRSLVIAPPEMTDILASAAHYTSVPFSRLIPFPGPFYTSFPRVVEIRQFVKPDMKSPAHLGLCSVQPHAQAP